MSLNRKFSLAILDLISELTDMSVAIYLTKQDELYFDKFLPSFCKEISLIAPDICTCYYNHDNKLHMCEAGIWCRSYPIGPKNDASGHIIIGHRRILGKDSSSTIALQDLIRDRKFNEFERIRLWSTFDEIPIVDVESFNSSLFSKISALEQYILQEHERAESEKKRAEDLELQKENLRVRSIRAAHEFQIPIQSMIGISEYLYNCIKKNYPNCKCGRNKTTENLSYELMEKLVKLSYIANNLRDVNINSLRYDIRKVNYVDILNYTINLFRGEAESKNVRINDLELINEPLHKIECSEQHIKQLFFNIIHNAVKYSFEGTTDSIRFISVACFGYMNYVKIQVSNYGVGIMPDELEKGLVFLQGYRGQWAGDRCRIGSGLGLWIAKRTIDDHHGKIKIESKKMGASMSGDPYKTTVTIDLPIWQPLSYSCNGFFRGY